MNEKNLLSDRCRDSYSLDFYEVRNISLQPNREAFMVIYALDGEFEYCVSFERHRMVRHDFVLVDVDDFFSLRALHDSGMICVISVYIPWLEQYYPYIGPIMLVCDSFSNETAGFLSREALKNVKSMIEEIIVLGIEGNDGWQEHILPLFHYFTEHFTISDYRLDDSQNLFRHGKEEIYYQVCQLVEESYMRSDCVSYVKSQLHYSPEYVNRVFRAFVGSSVQENVNNIRCWKTEEMLILTDEKIVDIACQCGFSDVKYYYKYFKQWYGMTPRVYRQKCRENMKREDQFRRLGPAEVYRLTPVFAPKRILVPTWMIEKDRLLLKKLRSGREKPVIRVVWAEKTGEEWIAFFKRVTDRYSMLDDSPDLLECMSVISYGKEYRERQKLEAVKDAFPRLHFLYTVYLYDSIGEE